jgi:L-ascorbate metabolism protein UlaG (beta-lactamase superfamily)
MKLTKYEHACFTLEQDSKVLVVDPGGYTTDLIAPENVVAVVITHQHPDHFDPEHLAEIFDQNDDVLTLGPADVIDKVEIENKRAVAPGEKVSVGPFDLEFFGGIHALIHEVIPRVQNLGVLINDLVFYPGDSTENPNRPVDTLILPVAAPWLKLSQAIDLMLAVKPRLVIPTHDAILSDIGKELVDRVTGGLAQSSDIEYTRPSSPIDI